MIIEQQDVPSSIYNSGIHTPDRAFENQCLISMVVEVSTISLNVSHILLNTWVGNKTDDNKFPMVGLSSFPNDQGEYYSIYGTPKLQISGGNSITPTISDSQFIYQLIQKVILISLLIIVQEL